MTAAEIGLLFYQNGYRVIQLISAESVGSLRDTQTMRVVGEKGNYYLSIIAGPRTFSVPSKITKDYKRVETLVERKRKKTSTTEEVMCLGGLDKNELIKIIKKPSRYWR